MAGGFFAQRNGMQAVNIAAACGVMTPRQLSGLAAAVEEAGAWRVKLTGRHTVVVLLDGEGDLDRLVLAVEKLGLKVAPYGSTVRAVKACPGNSSLCPRALGDALELGIAIQEQYMGREVPKDFKIAVCGCYRGCTDPYCADFGVVARGKNSFDVYLGGRGGSTKPRHGQKLAEGITSRAVLQLLEHVLDRYCGLAEPKERLSACLDRVGCEKFMPPAPLEKENSGTLEEFAAFLKGGAK